MGMADKQNSNPGADVRLRELRIAAGYRSARAAALQNDWIPATYLQHERGDRTISPERAQAYAKTFGGDWRWLLTGITPQPESALPEKLHSQVKGSEFVHLFNQKNVLVGTIPNALAAMGFTSSYAVRIDDMNSAPRYMPREIIYCEPTLGFRIGDYVVLRRANAITPYILLNHALGILTFKELGSNYEFVIDEKEAGDVHIILGAVIPV